MAKFTAGTAGEFGRRGGRAKQAARALSPEEITAGLPPFNGPDNVRRALDQVARWCLAGRCSASAATAVVRAARRRCGRWSWASS